MIIYRTIYKKQNFIIQNDIRRNTEYCRNTNRPFFLKYKKELTEYGYEVGKIPMKEQTVIFNKVD